MASEDRFETTEYQGQQPAEPWSILTAAGGDVAEADRIAAALVYKCGLWDRQIDAAKNAADRTIDQIKRVTESNIEGMERQKARLAFYLQEYQAVNPPVAGRTKKYFTGDTSVRSVPAGISVNKEAVIKLAETDDSLVSEGIVKLVPTVDAKLAKKRWAVDDEIGAVMDTKTGEILPGEHQDPIDGDFIDDSLPLKISTPAHESFSVKPIAGVEWLPGMLPDVEPPDPPMPADESEVADDASDTE
jgi:hypothetical protein